MKFTLDWLKSHLSGDYTLDDVVATLNRIGHEVEGVEDPAAKLAGFRIARVLTAERHPQADKLQVLSVDTGDGAEPLQVVCGAPNARAGMVGVLGLPGAVVPANGMELKVSAIRGVTSNGMMCSARELGLGDEHDGILDLYDAEGAVGTAYADYAGAGDPVIDVSITPNRQDCMGVRGIARDLAAAGLGTLVPLEVPVVEGAGEPPAIGIDDAAGCPAFWGRAIRGVDATRPTPDWMKRRLEAVGQRSINLIVDITNYVMLDLGRPSHAYDMAGLTGTLTARAAREGEGVTALNGKDYTLEPGMTVIADDARVHDIAGIMGGQDSGVSEATRDVLLEVAYFTPERIALTGQALALTSDARTRFERGVDPAFLDDATAILTFLITHYAGGEASAVARVGEPPVATPEVTFDPSLTARLGGVEVSEDEQAAILERLGFTVERGAPWRVTVPSWRRDIDGGADLVEEVLRIRGYDAIPSTPLPRAEGVALATATAEQRLERRLRRTAAALGLGEVVTWSFIAEGEAARFGGAAHVLANPISEELKAMRPSLLPGLLGAASRNAARGEASVRLFEIGRRYLADGEHPTLTLLLTGDAAPRGWQNGRASPVSPFEAKRLAEALLEAAGAPVERLQVMDAGADVDGLWHPGQSASLRLGPKAMLARFGTLHPALLAAYDINGAAVAVEIFLEAIPMKRAGGSARPAFTPRLQQSVTRDFAFLVPETLAAGELVRAVRGADKASIVAARVFDRFTGAGVPDGQTSVGVEVTLQPGEKSFTDAEIKAIGERIVAVAAKLGATLRA